MCLEDGNLIEDAYSLTMERLTRSIPLASTSDEYARQLNEHKTHSHQMDDKLDRETRTRYSRQHSDLQDKMIEETIHSEYLLRIWKK
jgi:hypothetical protein